LHVKKQTLLLVYVFGNLSFCQSILSPFDLIEVAILVVDYVEIDVLGAHREICMLEREKERERGREGGKRG
jgi:hypothetical protein